MTTLQELAFPPVHPANKSPVRALIDQSALAAGRVLRNWRSAPGAIVQSIVYPAFMLLMFRVVLGNSIDATSAITGQRAIFGNAPMMCLIGAMSGASVGAHMLQSDAADGLLSRLQTLPIHRYADLIGRLLVEIVRIVATCALLLAISFGLGFRFELGFWRGICMIGLIVLFGVAFVTATTAAATYFDGPRVLSLVMILTTLFMFFNTGFVPLMAYPTWLQDVVANQPVSCVINTARGLTDSRYSGDLGIELAKTVGWSAGIIALCARAAVVGYARLAVK